MRILYITTISLTMNSFFKPHIEMLVREGHEVDIACNCNGLALDDLYNKLGCKSYQVDFSRSPLSISNFKAFGQLKNIIKNSKYDIVHCHTPNASFITRLVCRKFRKTKNLKVFYTAHGFHFYKNAPFFNWMVYYPAERFCSRYTDKLITINKEDYELAKNKFKAKEVHYVPGVGIDVTKFENVKVDRKLKRTSIGVPVDSIVLTSVGELIERKNHKIVLNTLAEMNNKNIHYLIVGKGELFSELTEIAKKKHISDQVHFLGYRTDIAEIYKISDICCLPSIHEGLPVALMEAMICGLPAVCSRIRGNTDLIDDNGGSLFNARDTKECQLAINKVLNGDKQHMGAYNQNFIKNFSLEKVLCDMKTIYSID